MFQKWNYDEHLGQIYYGVKFWTLQSKTHMCQLRQWHTDCVWHGNKECQVFIRPLIDLSALKHGGEKTTPSWCIHCDDHWCWLDEFIAKSEGETDVWPPQVQVWIDHLWTVSFWPERRTIFQLFSNKKIEGWVPKRLMKRLIYWSLFNNWFRVINENHSLKI